MASRRVAARRRPSLVGARQARLGIVQVAKTAQIHAALQRDGNT
jgi:hypothetical protein